MKAAGDALRRVAEMVEGARAETHGNAAEQWKTAARLINVAFQRKLAEPLDEADIGVLMILTKISRLSCGKRDADHLDDIAGYAALSRAMLDTFVVEMP